MDPALVGCWRVVGIDPVGESAVKFLAGLPADLVGDLVEFLDAGCCVTDAASGRPRAVYLCRTFRRGWLACLDVRSAGPPPRVTRCVYRVDGDRLSICMAGDHGPRPRAVRRDEQRLWCVMTLARSERPKTAPSGLARLTRVSAA